MGVTAQGPSISYVCPHDRWLRTIVRFVPEQRDYRYLDASARRVTLRKVLLTFGVLARFLLPYSSSSGGRVERVSAQGSPCVSHAVPVPLAQHTTRQWDVGRASVRQLPGGVVLCCHSVSVVARAT